MRATEPVFRWWREQGNPSPLLLTEHEVQTSTDCFAIEFHDIREHHRILYGRDVISPWKSIDSFYRAQVEHELRAKLLRLRQKASGILSDKDVLRRLLVDSVSTFCVLFRHALILHGVEAPRRRSGKSSTARASVRNRPRLRSTSCSICAREPQTEGSGPEALLPAYHERQIGIGDRRGRRTALTK